MPSPNKFGELDQYRDTLPPPPPPEKKEGKEDSPFEAQGESVSVIQIKKEMGLETKMPDLNGDKQILSSDGSYGAVIDGIGPSGVADLISESAQSEISKTMEAAGPIINKSEGEARALTAQAPETANAGIKNTKYEAGTVGGGASLSMINFCENGKKAVIGQIGDTEILRVRDGNIERITPKNSAVDFLEKGGYVNEDQTIQLDTLDTKLAKLEQSGENPEEGLTIKSILFEARLKVDRKKKEIKLRKPEIEEQKRKEKKQAMIDKLKSGDEAIVPEETPETKLKDALLKEDQEDRPLILHNEKDRKQLIGQLAFAKARKIITRNEFAINLEKIQQAQTIENTAGKPEEAPEEEIKITTQDLRGMVTKALSGLESPDYQIFDTEVIEGDEFILLTKGVDLPEDKIMSLTKTSANPDELSKSLIGESRMQMLDIDNREALFTDATAVVIKAKKTEEAREEVPLADAA